MHKLFLNEHKILDNKVMVTGEDYNHIANVLRLKPDDEITISDGQGQDYYCIIERISGQEVILRIEEALVGNNELPIKVYLFQGLPKKDKMELIIQKSIELGVFEIIPVEMKRSIVKISNEKAGQKSMRWNKIAQSAAAQSKRAYIPIVQEPMTFKEAVAFCGNLEASIILSEKETDLMTSRAFIQNLAVKTLGVFIGPEGGFDEEEFNVLSEHKVKSITLGKRILRTETASLAVLSVIGFLKEE